MPLYFDNKLISISGDYVKFNERSASKVKFGSTDVWVKSVEPVYEITLSGTGGTWNKSSIQDIPSGTPISYSVGTYDVVTLTAGSQTARFGPYYVDEVEHYNFSSITNASGNIGEDRTVTATATQAYQEWEGSVYLDVLYQTSDRISLGNFEKVKLFYTFIAYDVNTREEVYFYDETLIMPDNDTTNIYWNGFRGDGYGDLGVNISTRGGYIDFVVDPSSSIGDYKVTLCEVYKILYL